MATILGIESTCDETAAAVVTGGRAVESSVIATQFELHAPYRGVVPEIASRAHIENINAVVRAAVDQAGITFDDLDAIAVAYRPGLIGSLLVGVTAAKTLAWSLGKPLIAVDHVQAHLYSVVLDSPGSAGATLDHPVSPPLYGGFFGRAISSDQSKKNPAKRGANGAKDDADPNSSHRVDVPFPAVGLVCSGGHTALYHLQDWSTVKLIGSTIDDAVGEAYDKVAAILGLPFPGGPVVDRLAADGDPKAVKFPRTMLDRESLDFSFSGLKTAVLYHVRGVPTKAGPPPPRPPLTDAQVKDVAASFQAACVDVIVSKLERARQKFDGRSIVIGGGVSANRGLRAAVASLGAAVFVPPLKYCTDNGAMIAGLADVHFRARRFATLDLDAVTFSEIPR